MLCTLLYLHHSARYRLGKTGVTLLVQVDTINRARTDELRRIQKLASRVVRNLCKKPGKFTQFLQRTLKLGRRLRTRMDPGR